MFGFRKVFNGSMLIVPMEKVELCINNGKKDSTSEKDDDTKANRVTQAVPLRQRQLPSSFWEEPNRPQLRGDVPNVYDPLRYQEPVRNLSNKHSYPLFDRSNRINFSYCCVCCANDGAGRDGHLCHEIHYRDPGQAFVPLSLDLTEKTERARHGAIPWEFTLGLDPNHIFKRFLQGVFQHMPNDTTHF